MNLSEEQKAISCSQFDRRVVKIFTITSLGNLESLAKSHDFDNSFPPQ